MKEYIATHINNHYSHAFAGGTLTAFIASISDDIFRTIILAMVGAAVSYFTSVAIKYLWEKLTGKKSENKKAKD